MDILVYDAEYIEHLNEYAPFSTVVCLHEGVIVSRPVVEAWVGPNDIRI